MKLLLVLTSHDELGSTGKKTGFWLEELAAPYYRFKDAGVQMTLASPKGGKPPLDPKSDAENAQTDATRRFRADATATAALAHTAKLSTMKAADFDAVFYPGGHGPLWDLTDDASSIALIESMIRAGKPVAAVCHAPCVLLRVRGTTGRPFVEGKRVTGFSNDEEAAVDLTTVVPFLVEDELGKLGARYEKGSLWEPFVVADGDLITGQNPASSGPAADRLLDRLTHRRHHAA